MNGRLVDVGKGTIVKTKDPLFHRKQMPDNTSRVSVARSENDGFYVIHLMMEYRRDVQSHCMKSSSDTHIQRWVEAFGAVSDNRLRNDFYRIQQEIASIIIKDVLEENGMFYTGPISRADVRTRIALQRQDMTPFTKLGSVLPDMDRWEECTA